MKKVLRTIPSTKTFSKAHQYPHAMTSVLSGNSFRILIVDANEDVATTLKYYGRSSDNAANLALNYDLLNRLQEGCDGFCFEEVVESWMNSKDEFVVVNWMVLHI